jgi:serine/threonine protein phosphatase PrpC
MTSHRQETGPFIRLAKSRKIQKGEDFERVQVCASWESKTFSKTSASFEEGLEDEEDEDDKREGTNKTHEKKKKKKNERLNSEVEFVFCSLFDGHGGKSCAEFASDDMLNCLLKALNQLEAEMKKSEKSRVSTAEDVFELLLERALVKAFEMLDEKFLKKDVRSGCTATVVIVNGRNVTTAAVGDSLAILDCPNRKGTTRLTNEHRLDCSDGERKRIIDFGGEVRPTEFEDGPNGERRGVGPLRVWPGGLAVSRSIGDRDGKKGGVISVPDVCRVLLDRSILACRIVIASDGLWDAATPKMVSAETRKMNCQNAAAALVKLSQKAKFDNRDDVTVIVLDLDYHDDDNDVKAHPFVGIAPSNNADEPSPRAFWPLAAKGKAREKDEYDELPSERMNKIREEIAERVAQEKQREIEIEMQRLERERIALEEKRRREEEEMAMFEEVPTADAKSTKNKNNNKNTKDSGTVRAKKANTTNSKTATAMDVSTPAAVATLKKEKKSKENKKTFDKKMNGVDASLATTKTMTTAIDRRQPLLIPPPLPQQPPPLPPQQPPLQQQQHQNKNTHHREHKLQENGDDDDDANRSDIPPKKKRNSKKNIIRKVNAEEQRNHDVSDPLHIVFQHAVSLPPSPAQQQHHHHHQNNYHHQQQQQQQQIAHHFAVAPTTANALDLMAKIGMFPNNQQQQQQQQQQTTNDGTFKRKGKKERQRMKAKTEAS